MQTDERLAQYPLRQALLPGAEGLAIFAERGTVEWLSRPERFLIVCEGRGGSIYASNECALAEAQALVQDVHGTQVVCRPPEIHRYQAEDGNVVEPLMFVRLKAPVEYLARISEDLARRDVTIEEQDVQHHDVVVRAQGWLQDLMGYPQALEELTGGSATLWTWLLRYQVRSTPPAAPGPSAAPRSRD